MVERWRFEDPYTDEVYTFPVNPSEMTSPWPEKNVTTRTSTAVDGQFLLFEGAAPPHTWTFTGKVYSQAHHAAMVDWCGRRRRLRLRDHFGRWFDIYIVRFDPTPQRVVNLHTAIAQANPYWVHNYTVTALVLGAPSSPTVQVS